MRSCYLNIKISIILRTESFVLLKILFIKTYYKKDYSLRDNGSLSKVIIHIYKIRIIEKSNVIYV